MVTTVTIMTTTDAFSLSTTKRVPPPPSSTSSTIRTIRSTKSRLFYYNNNNYSSNSSNSNNSNNKNNGNLDPSLSIVVSDNQLVDIAEKVNQVFLTAPPENPYLKSLIQNQFPFAVSNQELVSKVVSYLSSTHGVHPHNTLLSTSFCCDELARQLEDDFRNIYGNNFNLGGLAGFPFAGKTGFTNFAIHIPDGGFGIMVYGPHVGMTNDGTVGKVKRKGVEYMDNCCRSAIAANRYVQSITDGKYGINAEIQNFFDYQQKAVQELILPHGKRLADAEDRMVELPYAIFASQDVLMEEIVRKGAHGLKAGLAVLGGIQINTGPDSLDYFVPLRFDFVNRDGEVVEDMLHCLDDY